MQHTKCGLVYEVKPNVFLSGCRCPNCRKNKKITTDDFKLKVLAECGNEYEVLGEVVSAKKKVQMKHNECCNEFEMEPSVFLLGHRCPHCYKTIPYTTESYSQKVYELVGDKYSVLGEYVRGDVKIKMRHNICGHEWAVRPSLFIHGNRCPQCSSNLRRSLPEEIVAYFLAQYFDIVQGYRPDWLAFPSGLNGEIDIWIPNLKIGVEYDGIIHNSNTTVERDNYKNTIINNTDFCNKLYRIKESGVVDNVLGGKITNIYLLKEINISGGKGIDELESAIKKLLKQLNIDYEEIVITKDIIQLCQNKLEENYQQIGSPIRKRKPTHKKTHKEFCDEVYDAVGNEYTVLSKYSTANEKICIRHEKCGFEYTVKPSVFLSGRRCPKCGGTLKMDTDSFKKRVKESVGDEYTVLGEYVNNRTKILLRHNVCMNEWSTVPNSFLLGHRCAFCAGKEKVTTEIYRKKVTEKYGQDFSVLGEYINTSSKILICHNKCGYQWMVRAGSFLYRGKCPKCSKNSTE